MATGLERSVLIPIKEEGKARNVQTKLICSFHMPKMISKSVLSLYIYPLEFPWNFPLFRMVPVDAHVIPLVYMYF